MKDFFPESLGHKDGCALDTAKYGNTSMNVHVQVFMWTCVFISLGYKPGSRTAGTHDLCLAEELPGWLPQQLRPLTFLTVLHEGSHFSTASPNLVISCFFFFF